MTTTTAPTPTPVRLQPTGTPMVRLVRAEMQKIWTTNTWWILGIIALVTTGLALTINLFQADSELGQIEQLKAQGPPQLSDFPPPEEGGPSTEELARIQEQYQSSIDVGRILLRNAANIYTSGQYFGLMFIVILGALIVTNEFFHQTATTTFLTTPHRTTVILSKLAAAMGIAFAFWAVLTVIDLAVGSTYFALSDYAIPLTDWPVLRSVLLNLLAYMIWAVLGIGLGVLIRSQLGATLTGALAYVLSYFIAIIFFGLIRQFVIKEDWVWDWVVSVPGVASQVMVSPEPLQIGPTSGGPQWWVGALVLIGYGLFAGVVGTLITRKRDIS